MQLSYSGRNVEQYIISCIGGELVDSNTQSYDILHEKYNRIEVKGTANIHGSIENMQSKRSVIDNILCRAITDLSGNVIPLYTPEYIKLRGKWDFDYLAYVKHSNKYFTPDQKLEQKDVEIACLIHSSLLPLHKDMFLFTLIQDILLENTDSNIEIIYKSIDIRKRISNRYKENNLGETPRKYVFRRLRETNGEISIEQLEKEIAEWTDKPILYKTLKQYINTFKLAHS